MASKKQSRANKKLYEARIMEAEFPITAVTRTDLVNKEIGFTRKQALQITDAEMQKIASKMADDYISQLYWHSLKVRATITINKSITKPE